MIFLIGAGSGYLFANGGKTKIETIASHEEDNTQTEKNEHKVTTIEVTPDGIHKTTITDDIKTDQMAKRTEVTTKESKESSSKEKTQITALAGIDTAWSTKGSTTPIIYGISLQRNIIGNISIGGWGMTNKSFGMSIGISL